MDRFPDYLVEEKLLLKCVTLDRDGYENQWIRDVLTQKEVNWEYFIKLSRFHGVFPLVFDAVEKLDWVMVPKGIVMWFRKLWQEYLARNIVLHCEFDHLMEQFSKEGIGVIPLKGVCWARQLYPDENLRSFNDLDFLVKLEDVDGAKNLLRKKNYEPIPYIDTDCFPENSWELQLYKQLPGGWRISIDLHWGLARPRDYHIPLTQWWSKAQEVKMKGENYLALSLEHTLLYLTIDLHTSRYMYLKQLIDLRQFLIKNQSEVDWPYVEESLKMMGLWSNFCFSMIIIHNLFNDHMGIADSIRLRQSQRIKILERLFNTREIIRGRYGEDLRQFLLILILNDRFCNILKSAVRTLFPSLEAIAYRYSIKPDSEMIYLLYLLNPFYSIFRLIRGKKGHRS